MNEQNPTAPQRQVEAQRDAVDSAARAGVLRQMDTSTVLATAGTTTAAFAPRDGGANQIALPARVDGIDVARLVDTLGETTFACAHTDLFSHCFQAYLVLSEIYRGALPQKESA